MIVSKLKSAVRNVIPAPELQYTSIEYRKKKLKKFYKLRMGNDLNLDNPKLFNEKMQWYKLYYTHPDMKRCVDKIDFKDYVRELIGEGCTAKIIAIWNSPDEVSIKDIKAKKYVIKSTLQSDGNFIYLVTDADSLDIPSIEQEIKNKWFDTRLLLTNSYCSAYYGAKPRVVIEEFIEEFANAANDYKLFCFNGKPAFFYVAEDHFKNGENQNVYPITFFDLEWNPMEVHYGEHTVNPDVKKPVHFEEMIELAKKLSEPFPFVRVDFFDTPNKLYLAELTFYPGGGLVEYSPSSFNKKMGDMLDLSRFADNLYS